MLTNSHESDLLLTFYTIDIIHFAATCLPNNKYEPSRIFFKFSSNFSVKSIKSFKR